MIEFKRRTNRKILGLTPNSALVIEAIRATGKEHISDRVRKKIRKKFSVADIGKLKKEAVLSRKWIYEEILKL